MSLQSYTNPNTNWKILHGNDTDVSWLTIIKFNEDLFMLTRVYCPDDCDSLEEHNQLTTYETCKWNLKDLNEEFLKQYGSPMQYISEDDFNWMITDL